VGPNLGLVELAQHSERRKLSTPSEHSEAGMTHRRQSLGRHRVDAICRDELKPAGSSPFALAVTIA